MSLPPNSPAPTPDIAVPENPLRIVVLPRGWVAVGRLTPIDDTALRLSNAAIVRRWGTTDGLGQLASKGPTESTVLDDCPDLHFIAAAVILTMECNAAFWPNR